MGRMTESLKSEAVRLYFEENREESEIAEALNISMRQVKTVLGDLARLETYKKRSEAAKLRAQICKLGAELLSGRQGGAIRDMANSPEAKKLGAAIDPAAAERAVRSGDAAQLKALLTQILSTNEGKALAEKLSRFENGK